MLLRTCALLLDGWGGFRRPADRSRVMQVGGLARATGLVALAAAGCLSVPVVAQRSVEPVFNRLETGSTPHALRSDASGESPGEPVAFDPGIPTPASAMGYAIGQAGDDSPGESAVCRVPAVRYEPMVRYLRALAESSPLVTLTPYAVSHEGRTLYFLTITSQANHAMLEEIKRQNAKLADPRMLTGPDEGARIMETLPAVAWLAYSIHGDELSSTDAALEVAYRLASRTDAETKRLRDELVIHIDPLQNPDGRERYLGQLQHLTGKVPINDYQALRHRGLWAAGRGNHYLFDLNRDWAMQVHPETRGRGAQILAWNPHLLVDSHEMGGMDTYLFDPPREPFNVNLSETNLAWRLRFSADQAKAFDRFGWSYYTREWYEEWYPGYTNAWANLLGAVGLLYEQAGVSAGSVKQATGSTLSYDESVEHHVVSSLANLETLRANRREILRDFLKERQSAVSTASSFPGDDVASAPRGGRQDVASPPTEYDLKSRGSGTFLLPPGPDRAGFNRLADVLGLQGIEVAYAGGAFEAHDAVDIWGEKHDTLELPEGTLVVKSAQPRRRLMHALLSFDPHMSDEFLVSERRDLENHRGSRIYDVTAWNLSMACGLEAYWAGGLSDVSLLSAPPPPSLSHGRGSESAPPKAREGREDLRPTTQPTYGYLIDAGSSDRLDRQAGSPGPPHTPWERYRAIVGLLDSGCRLRAATKPFKIGGRGFQPGTVLIRRHENPDNLADLLEQATADLGVVVIPVDTALCEEGPDLGGRRFRLLEQPRIAVASQWPISTTSFGSTWFLLDVRLGARASPVSVQSIGRIDLRKYNVIVLPSAWGGRSLGGVLTKSVLQKLKKWVQAGGTLIAMGGSAAFLSGKDREFSSVRLRRDVLDELAVYEEAIERERSARVVEVDPAEVWGLVEPEPDDARPERREGRGTEPRPSGSGHAEDEAPQHDKKNSAKPPAKVDLKKLKRTDAWQRLFGPRGVIVAADLDCEHWLCFGVGAPSSVGPHRATHVLSAAKGVVSVDRPPYPPVDTGRLPVLISGSYAFMSKYPVATPVRLKGKDDLRLSGLLWPEARARRANGAYATVERMGKGQVILFASDPFFRGYFEGTGRLLLNAIVLGPGLGASPPVPW